MSADPSTKPWAIASAVLFTLAVLMGAGPGVHLVNPPASAAAAAAADFFVFGMPKIYVWGVFWFAMQATALVIAYVKVWKS